MDSGGFKCKYTIELIFVTTHVIVVTDLPFQSSPLSDKNKCVPLFQRSFFNLLQFTGNTEGEQIACRFKYYSKKSSAFQNEETVKYAVDCFKSTHFRKVAFDTLSGGCTHHYSIISHICYQSHAVVKVDFTLMPPIIMSVCAFEAKWYEKVLYF